MNLDISMKENAKNCNSLNLKMMKNDDKCNINNSPASEDARHDTLRTTASTCASWRNPTGLFWNESFKVSKFQSFIKGFFLIKRLQHAGRDVATTTTSVGQETYHEVI